MISFNRLIMAQKQASKYSLDGMDHRVIYIEKFATSLLHLYMKLK